MSNQFGKLFRITTFGESHGVGIGVIIDGCPAGLAISIEDIQKELDRRKPGQSELTTSRNEADKAVVQSGIFEGKTLGTPISIFIQNKDSISSDYDEMKSLYRPGHADYTYQVRYGIRDWRGGGRSSNRESAARVAAAAIAKKMNETLSNLDVLAWVDQVHHYQAEVDIEKLTRADVEKNAIRCPDSVTAEKMRKFILELKEQGDSVGGVVKFRVKNCPIGLGSPVFGKMSSELASALMSINATKNFELGLGAKTKELLGSSHNDSFALENGKIRTTTNRAGGLLGGITNGETLYGSLTFKPTATIRKTQTTVNQDLQSVAFSAKGRHDPCVLPRAVPIVEAMIHLVLADQLLLFPLANMDRLQTFYNDHRQTT